uniref:Large ribosomal subunit protein mL43 n=1 Tax=Chromera velia CCMP2878 TaxID=1169474 RepID=A0A0G4F1Z5_9ALVE|eukprot:Cvel_14680.t1-p1 / transcript=Cvel_14680.t1 / gene=Cvel_14680 / organism=Chromera_velia_CCMP2878 / gene_product=hypothetical protein / transcript_product=hypothetical protein / location=Cvel_scaffold1053:12839-16168(-) / protein_length=204 / sequence_SO=supercontig / SO=protein_coding / is_pseudo=false
MCTRGVWNLQNVIIRYSETGHCSRGVRFYFRHCLQAWKDRNPQVNVKTVHSQFEGPRLTCEFLWREGITTSTSVPLKCLRPRQIEELLDLYRNSESGNDHLVHGGPKVWTEKRSIQGLWQPSLEGQIKALSYWRKKPKGGRLPKYTNQSLKLSKQAIRGQGRWGSETDFPKGWDQISLRNVFKRPFEMPPGSASVGHVGRIAPG